MLDFARLEKDYMECKYSMSADSSQYLREGLQAVQLQITKLEAQRDGKKGKERGAVTRKITPLERKRDALLERLQGVPPLPLEPLQMADYVLEWESECKKLFEDELVRFCAQVQEATWQFSDTLSWKMETLVRRQCMWICVGRIYKVACAVLDEEFGKDAYDDCDIAYALLDAAQVVYLAVVEEQLRNKGISSSLAHNAVEYFERRARSRFLQDCEWRIERMYAIAQRVQIWEELHPNGEEDGDG